MEGLSPRHSTGSNTSPLPTPTKLAFDKATSPAKQQQQQQQNHHSHQHTNPQKRHSLFSFGQLVAAMAGAASVSSVMTAILATRFLSNIQYYHQHQSYTDFVLSTNYERSYGIENGIDLALNYPGTETQSHLRASIFTNNDTEHAGSTAQNAMKDLDRLKIPKREAEEESQTDSRPKIAWLMSFPNSGTSYTLHMVRQLSNTITATNYALEGEIKDRPSVSIHSEMSNGPWLELVPSRPNDSIPRNYILTKTHCGGFCNHCLYEKFLETPRSFQTACRTGTKAYFPAIDSASIPNHDDDDDNNKIKNARNNTGSSITSGSNNDANTTQQVPRKGRVTYDLQRVQKAIHLIRNPLDNIVARFHLDFYRKQAMTNGTFGMVFPNNKTGFQNWCSYYDGTGNGGINGNNSSRTTTTTTTTISPAERSRILATLQTTIEPSVPLSNVRSWDKNNRWIDDELQNVMKGVPCRGEFYRYVQWHNNAFTVLRDMNIPVLTVHYEDYQNEKGGNATRASVLKFLELIEPQDQEHEERGQGEKSINEYDDNNNNDNDKEQASGGEGNDDNNIGITFESNGKNYGDFYSTKQKDAIWRFIAEFASRDTWHGLDRYLEKQQEHYHYRGFSLLDDDDDDVNKISDATGR